MDGTIIKYVVVALSTIAVLCVGGLVYLSASGREQSASAIALAGFTNAAIGALVGILASQRNPPHDPPRATS